VSKGYLFKLCRFHPIKSERNFCTVAYGGNGLDAHIAPELSGVEKNGQGRASLVAPTAFNYLSREMKLSLVVHFSERYFSITNGSAFTQAIVSTPNHYTTTSDQLLLIVATSMDAQGLYLFIELEKLANKASSAAERRRVTPPTQKTICLDGLANSDVFWERGQTLRDF